MAAGSPPTKRFSNGRAKIPDEAAIVARLAVPAAGLDVPKQLRRR